MGHLEELQARLQSLETELRTELEALRVARGYRLEGRRVVIEKAIRRAQRAQRKRVVRYLWESRLRVWLTGPVIWGGLLAAAFLDAFASLYQAACFPVYGIPRVQRSDFLVLDRAKLPYLNWIEKAGCLYCNYFNGVVACAQETAARTEQHRCPIKHARRPGLQHSRYRRCFDYGDAEAYRALRDPAAELRGPAVRALISPAASPGSPPGVCPARAPSPGRCPPPAWRPRRGPGQGWRGR
jgi:hypothetical protein